MANTIMGWMGENHPDIHMALFVGMAVAHDPECIEAMRSPRGVEQWLKRRYPTAYKEWEEWEAAKKRG